MAEENEQIHEGILFAESIFGAKTRRGLVKISYGITFEIICSPDEARKFALSVIEAAEAAESDELIMSWLRNRIGVRDESKSVLLLREFRQMRESFRKRDLLESEGN